MGWFSKKKKKEEHYCPWPYTIKCNEQETCSCGKVVKGKRHEWREVSFQPPTVVNDEGTCIVVSLCLDQCNQCGTTEHRVNHLDSH